MPNLLALFASPRENDSASIQAANLFLDALPSDVTVTTLNLFDAALADYTPVLARAKHNVMLGNDQNAEEARQWAQVEALVDQFLATDHFLFAVPMWNFSVPYKLKQYIDLVTHPGMTFTMDKDGPRGLGSATGTVIYARGGSYTPIDGKPDPFDFQSPYMSAWCSLVGIDPLEEVLVEGTLAGPDGQSDAVNSARERLQTLARQVAAT